MVDQLETKDERHMAIVVKQLREYLYRVRQVFDHSYSSELPRRWWPAFVLLDDMECHLPFLIEYLTGGKDREGGLEWPESLIEFEERIGKPVRGPRAFTADEKRVLYFQAGGRCCICREKLKPDWEADHIEPWSKGGPTTLENGQALCRPCNSMKRAKLFEDR